jgi:hypothetical protein
MLATAKSDDLRSSDNGARHFAKYAGALRLFALLKGCYRPSAVLTARSAVAHALARRSSRGGQPRAAACRGRHTIDPEAFSAAIQAKNPAMTYRVDYRRSIGVADGTTNIIRIRRRNDNIILTIVEKIILRADSARYQPCIQLLVMLAQIGVKRFRTGLSQ